MATAPEPTLAKILPASINWLSHRLPGNLKSQNALGMAVGAMALHALALSLFELIGATELRVATGSLLQNGSKNDPLYEAGSSLGFYAALLFALNFILATRWQWMERLFGGASRVYALHAFAGKTALTFVVLHTGTLLVQALPDWSLLATYLLPGRDWAYTLGIVGTLGLLILVAMTIWIKMPYRSWLKTHKLMIIPFLGGTLHAIVLQGDWYMILTVAVGSYAWFDGVFLQPRRGVRAEVYAARTLGDVRELVLSGTTRFPPAPGKFVLLRLGNQRHPFSISGIDAQGRVRLSIRMSGPFTRSLSDVGIGTEATLHGPYGHFGEDILSAAGPQLWIAGGIGITPFLSTLQVLSRTRPDQAVHLVWSVQRRNQAIYSTEIEDLIAGMPKSRFTIHESGLLGKLTAAPILGTTQRPEHVFLCGPEGMTRDLEAQFQTTAGLRGKQIISERFQFR
jgi:predicted ferric reductase